MAAKPSIIPSWCTTGVRTFMNAAKIAVGYDGSERPLPAGLNALLGTLGDWAAYLSDGVFTGGGSMAGGFAVTGGLQADTAIVTGNAGVNGTTSLLGAVTMLGGAGVTGGMTVDTLKVTNPNAFTLEIPSSAADLNSNARVTDAFGAFAITLNGGTGPSGQSTFPIDLLLGDVITGFTVWVNKASSAASTISATLRVLDSTNGSTTSNDTASLSTNAPAFTTIPKTGLSRTVTAHHPVMLHVGMTAGTGVADIVYHVEITFNRVIT